MTAPWVELMTASASSSRRVRSGLFEIDLSSAELYKSGRKIPLQEQPFRVLAILLEHPGQVVSREELQSRLWQADTYVGFDEGINTAIRKLRQAFGDSADNPRFSETLSRRGYRFIAPVSETPGDAVLGGALAANASENAGANPTGLANPPTLEQREPAPGISLKVPGVRWSLKAIVAAVAVFVLIMAGVVHFLPARVSPDSMARKRTM